MTPREVDFNILISILIVAALILSWLIGGSVIGNTTYNEQDVGNNNLTKGVGSTSTTTTTSTSTTSSSTTTTPPSTTTSTSTTINIECFLNSDCGVNGTRVTREYTCIYGDIYRQYIRYRCSNPGSSSAECVGRVGSELIRECGVNEHCIGGEPFCEYLGDINEKGVFKRPSDSTLLDISNLYNNSYNEDRFSVAYVISKESEPEGVAIDIWKPDGNGTRVYCTYGNGIRAGDLVIGLVDLSRWGSDIWVNIWIQETNGF